MLSNNSTITNPQSQKKNISQKLHQIFKNSNPFPFGLASHRVWAQDLQKIFMIGYTFQYYKR